jgi:hypothetical protein
MAPKALAEEVSLMSNEKERNEKEEKDESQRGGEKWGGEKWASDPLGRVVFALILIWAGVAFLLVNLTGDGEAFLGIDEGNVWGLILAGAGVIIWLEVLLRVAMPAYRRPLGGRIILGTILLVIGLGGVFDVELWPLIIIAIGVSMLLGYLTGSRSS